MNDKKTIIAGIGNRLMSDDGFGPRVTDLLSKRELPSHIEVRDMGTAGLTIATDLAEFSRAIFIDAMEMEGDPGTIQVSRLQVESSSNNVIDLSRTTLHDAGLDGLLKFAKATKSLPEEVYLVGCNPKGTDVGLKLSDEVEAATHEAVKKIMELIKKG